MNPPSDETLFGEALGRPPGERAAYLAQACGNDAAQRARLESLLAVAEKAQGFMETSPADRLAGAKRDTVAGGQPEEKPGDRIDRFKLLQKLGEGGCGVVYVAEQEEPVRRRVALKVIKLGMDTREVIARFEAERQALALMDHPNIAKVLDAGATATGRPYFVMELVRGVPLTKYCDDQNATTAERLKLFIQICHAVQHAHQKGIIHRDLKPSNILVTINDGTAVPKIIDFGIAKATQGRLTDKTVYTAFEQFIGTPAYMSPEQAVMTSLDIDTRSDIYSLGVLLYELLTGRTPFDAKEMLAAGLDEIRRRIREVEPPKPSTRLSTMEGEALTAAAHRRQTEPPKLINLVRGDLDWIVMRCLEKDRTRRYDTANGLAEDIRRHLANEPVSASPPSTVYRFQKLVRRNKLAFAAAAAIAAALVIGAAVATWQAVRATRAERRAQAERDAANSARVAETQARELAEQRRTEAEKARGAEAAARESAERRREEVDTISRLLLSEALGSVAPKSSHDDPTLQAALEGREIALREVLDSAAQRIPNAFANNPLLEAAVRLTIGETYLKLSLYEKAAPHLQAARDTRRRLLGEEHPDTHTALRSLTTIWTSQQDFDQAEKALWQIHALQQRERGVDDPETLETLWQISYVRLMRLDIARPWPERELLLAEAVALARANHGKANKCFGPDDPRTLKHLQILFVTVNFPRLGGPLPRAANAQEAEAVGRLLLEAQRRVLGEAHPDTLATVAQYSKTLAAVGKEAEDERMNVEGIALIERILGPDHVTLGISLRHLAIGHLKAGRLREAAETFMRFAAGVPKRRGWDSANTRSFLHELGYILVHCGQAPEAEAFARERLPEALRRSAPDSAGVIALKFVLGAALVAQGRGAEAEPLLRECLVFANRQNPPDWGLESVLGEALLQQKRFAEAEPLLVNSFERMMRNRSEERDLSHRSFQLWDTYSRVLKLYTGWNRPEKVAEWRKKEAELSRVGGQRTWRRSPPTIPSRKAPENLSFETVPAAATQGDLALRAWTRVGNKRAAYQIAVDRTDAATSTLHLASTSSEPSDFERIAQSFSAEDYRGRRIRFSFQLKSEDVGNLAGGTMSILRQDGATVASSERRALGSSGWSKHTIVFDVPATAAVVSLAFQLRGKGSLWVREVRFEEVGREIPADNTLEHIGAGAPPPPPRTIPESVLKEKAPVNLNFDGSGPNDSSAQPPTGLPAGWSKIGRDVTSYRVEMDRSQTHTQPVSLHIKSVEPAPNGPGTVSQSFSAENYRGQRVRFSAWIKTQNVQYGAQLFMRVDQQSARGSLRFGNMDYRAPKGTTAWSQHAIVLDVPAEGAAIALGFFVQGTGEAWFADAKFEVVGPDVPTTDI